jgi:hypothetical protein
MSGDIVIVYAYLDTLASYARQAGDMLSGSSRAMNLSFHGNPEVTNAYDDFLDDWDRHRKKLREGVSAAADAFEGVSATFKSVEDQLIAALDGG